MALNILMHVSLVLQIIKKDSSLDCKLLKVLPIPFELKEKRLV